MTPTSALAMVREALESYTDWSNEEGRKALSALSTLEDALLPEIPESYQLFRLTELQTGDWSAEIKSWQQPHKGIYGGFGKSPRQAVLAAISKIPTEDKSDDTNEKMEDLNDDEF
jgi:hypothetical protein